MGQGWHGATFLRDLSSLTHLEDSEAGVCELGSGAGQAQVQG